MKSLDFPEAVIALAKDQPEYNTLFCFVGNTPERPMICQFELTDEEVADIVKNKRLFYSQFTFGNYYQPMSIFTKNPFSDPLVPTVPLMDDNKTPADEWDKTHYIDSHTHGVHQHPGPCMNCNNQVEDHYYSTRQCKL